MLKVIIADDEKLICRLVQALGDWEALDMEVAGLAENGLEALELIEKVEPDILITDIRMPGCDGLELIQRAKEMRPELEVIIISGYAHFEYAQSAIQYGVGTYLLKPIKKEQLMEALRKMRGRCEERLKREEGMMRQHKNSRNDLNLLRSSLVKDLLSDHAPALTREVLRDTYHFGTEGDTYQVFLIKIDCEVEEVNGSAAQIVRETVQELFLNGLAECCKEALVYFQSYTGYGVMNYEAAQKDQVRKCLRECFNQASAKKNLFGPVEFSLSLGTAVREPEEIAFSLKEAQDAMMERLIEGTGRLLEHVPKDSGIDKQGLLEKYVKVMDHVIEVLDVDEAREAAFQLESAAMGTEAVCGRELMELVLSAGRAFITRVAIHDIPRFHIGDFPRVEEVQQDFWVCCNQCGSGPELFDALRLLQETMLREAVETRDNEATRPIRIAKQYVMQHFHEPITMEEVCEMAGFSTSYFSVLFKKGTGEGFAKYLTRVRMEEAKTLLRETNLPVAEICEKVGYSDRKHFTHTFHKATGLNPAEYRKLYG